MANPVKFISRYSGCYSFTEGAMEPENRQTGLPVLLVHNLDPDWEPAEIEAASAAVGTLISALKKEGHRVTDVPVKSKNLGRMLQSYKPLEHVVFNWCEELPGVQRSDSLAARILEDNQFTYTGSTPDVLALSWDKPSVKLLLEKSGIPTPRWQVITTSNPIEWECFPAIVKPAFEHCSCGITTGAVVMDVRELRQRIAFIEEKFSQPAIVEDFIDGREFHVTLWGNGSIEVLPPAEMDFSAFDHPRDRLCTFDSKFTPGSVHYEKIELRIPALLDKKEELQLKRTAVRAYRMFGCRDYARIDLRLRNSVFYVLDINPNADISSDTSLVYAAEAIGLTYGAVGSRLVKLAAQRHPVFGRKAGKALP